MPKKRKNRLHKSQKRRKYKRSGKLSRKKSRKGGMKETTGLLDMSLLKSSGKLLDIDEIKRLYDSTFDYLKGLNESQMDETKELIDSQEIDEDKIKFLKNLFNIYNKVQVNRANIPRTNPIFNLKEEKECLEGYTTISTLGTGQYGTTFLVENAAGRQFALKQQTIKSSEWSPPIEEQIEMIKNEILISEKMGEINIGPEIYNSYTCEDDGSLKVNIVMEYMNAGTLKEWYGKNSFTEDHKEQIEGKITAAHDEGIFHGDLHLENIFVNIGEDGEPEFYLGDFGLGNTLEGLIDVRQQYDTNTFRDTLKTEQNDKYKDIIVKLFIVNGLV